MSRRPLYAWDSSIFLAWLSEEEDKPLGGIDSVVQEIDSGNASLLVSVVAYSEVLRAKHTAEQFEAFEKFLGRSNIVVADNDIRIAKKAEEGRSRALPRKKIKTADATHLATAIIYQADVFHTTDGKLIGCNGSPVVDGLKISLPISLLISPKFVLGLPPPDSAPTAFPGSAHRSFPDPSRRLRRRQRRASGGPDRATPGVRFGGS